MVKKGTLSSVSRDQPETGGSQSFRPATKESSVWNAEQAVWVCFVVWIAYNVAEKQRAQSMPFAMTLLGSFDLALVLRSHLEEDQVDPSCSKMFWRGQREKMPQGMEMACFLVISLVFLLQWELLQNNEESQRIFFFHIGLLMSLWQILGQPEPLGRWTMWILKKFQEILISIPLGFFKQDRLFAARILSITIVFDTLFQSIYSVPLMHKVWTRGEWSVVVSMLSFGVLNHARHQWAFSGNFTSGDSRNNPGTVYQVAQAGNLGAILFCPIVNVLWQSAAVNTDARKDKHNAHQTRHNLVWTRVGMSALLILGLVELELSLDNNQGHLSFPKCMMWLTEFLGETETSCFFVSETASSWPRYYWLLYWTAVLIVMMQLLPSLYWNWVGQTKPPSNSSSSITLKRKWFHLVAVLLFWPTTIHAPQMMALSYAIALSILILVEGLLVRYDQPNIQTFFEAFLDHRKNETSNEEGQTMIVSHMGLISGCAMPLFLALYLLETVQHEPNFVEFCRSLSLVGLVGLGIGDAAAAVTGTLYSQWQQHDAPQAVQSIENLTGLSKWGSCNRTWVGSICMFLSMFCSVWVLEYLILSSNLVAFWCWVSALLWMTAVEAYTNHLDNLVIPLVGAVSFLAAGIKTKNAGG